jgi:hypothetical protein
MYAKSCPRSDVLHGTQPTRKALHIETCLPVLRQPLHLHQHTNDIVLIKAAQQELRSYSNNIEYRMGQIIVDHQQTPVRHGRLRLSTGVRLHYYTAGSGPAVLLQHGIPKTSYYWRKVLPYLSPHFTCVVPDLRGIGDSTHPDSDYSMATVADDMAELMQQLGHEKYHVVGEDWGAAAAYQLAARYRDRVLSLVFQEMLLPGFGLEEWVRVPYPGLLERQESHVRPPRGTDVN